MRTYRGIDPRVEPHLLRAEETLEEALAYLGAEETVKETLASRAQRALIPGARPPRRRARVWLGSVLLAAGHRLLRSTPGPAAPA